MPNHNLLKNKTTPPISSSSDPSLSKRIKSSVISYSLRQIAIMGIILVYNTLLTRFLVPEEYGKVAVIMVILNISVLLADGGLGVYLIQRKDETHEEDLFRTTTIQIYASFALICCCFITAVLFLWIGKDSALIWMVAFTSLSLPFLVARGMALLILERHLHFTQVVRIEILEEVLFALVSIALALKGGGAWSIVAGQLAKSIFGFGLAVKVGKFRFRFLPVHWDEDLWRGLRFGFHYQAGQLFNMARVLVNPLFIIPFLGLQAGGFVERSWYFSGAALSIILAVQKKVIFPYFSRIQTDRNKIKTSIEDSIYISAVLDKFMFLPLVLFTPEIVQLIFGPQWLPMIPLMYWLFAGNIVFGALVSPLYPLVNGIGKSEIISKFNLMIFVLSWILIIPLTWVFGIQGVGIAGLLLWGTVDLLKKRIFAEIGEFVYYRQIWKPLLAFLLSFLSIQLLIRYISEGERILLPEMGVFSGLSLVIYAGTLFILDRSRIKHFRKMILNLQ